MTDKWDGTLTVIGECDEGVIVTVKDVPAGGLAVKCHYLIIGTSCGPGPGLNDVFEDEHTVTRDNPVAVFSDLSTAKCYCFRVMTDAEYVMSHTERGITPPGTGCSKITLYGFLGRAYRTRIDKPTTAKPGEAFTLEAKLFYADEDGWHRATEFMEVEFFRVSGTRDESTNTWETEESLDTNLTNADGVALLSITEEEEGTYKYIARYTGGDTFATAHTVSVKEVVCPIDLSAIEEACPILKASLGTIVFTKLDTLRWFRDTHMPESLVRMYYWLTPVTGLIARKSRLVRAIIREISWLSIKGIEKRWAPQV